MAWFWRLILTLDALPAEMRAKAAAKLGETKNPSAVPALMRACHDKNSKIAEAAVVGRPDELKGQVIVAFVTPRQGVTADDALARVLREHVAAQIGALARPEEGRFADSLPKTRSGKIMRRLLREVASGSTARGDTTTLEDQGVLETLAQAFASDD